MRILIISYYFPPMNSVASHRVYSWARTWADIGHTVTVLTAPKPSGDDNFNPSTHNIQIVEATNSYLSFLQKATSIKYRTNTSDSRPDSNKHPFLRSLTHLNEWRKKRGLFYTHRMPDYLSLWKHPALQKINDGKYDLVVSTFGPYATHLIAENIIETDRSVKWIADFRDLWIDHGSMIGLFPFTVIEKLIYKRILRKADIITTVSPPLADQIGKYCEKNKIFVIYNGFFPDLYSLTPSAVWPDKKIRLVYTGTVYEGPQDYTPLLRALKKLSASDPILSSELEIIIASRRYGNIFKQADKLGIGSFFKFVGNVPHSQCLQMQKDAHGLLFFDYDPNTMKGVITGKLFEYLVSGTEIWSIGQDDITTDSNNLILKSRAGTVFGTNDKKLYQYLRKVLHRKNKRQMNVDMKYLNQYDRRKQALKMLDAVSSCALGWEINR
jgi:glycosyltransferase involved in cell wall biosynthesis